MTRPTTRSAAGGPSSPGGPPSPTRTGYALLLAAVVIFFVALVVGFSGTMATLVLIPLLVSFALLAPAIVLGYAVKAAERDDRERGI